MKTPPAGKQAASSRGRLSNSGNGPCLQVIDIRHPGYAAVIQPETAFWALVRKDHLGDALTGAELPSILQKFSARMSNEMRELRFNLKPSAVYFNPTERCNLNCTYCYLPEKLRKTGVTLSESRLMESLRIIREYFAGTLPPGRKPQLVFHGSEPLINKEAVFHAVEKYSSDFDFGIQTNGLLLEKEDMPFLSSHKVALGISLDGHTGLIADGCRKDWASHGTFRRVLKAVETAKEYPVFLNIICTVTGKNVRSLVKIVEFFHYYHIENCLLNQVRCTLEGGMSSKPADHLMARMFTKALDRSCGLFRQTGRKIVIGNFANVLLAILAPSARRLMCDINPCGGGRCFFAVSAKGDIYPCSEFIGLPEFRGGNLFRERLDAILSSAAFGKVTGRRIENIEPCRRCAIRHFCGAPCPAEAHQMHGGMEHPGAFCEFYEQQVRYAFRLIADKKEQAYLWDGWDKNTAEMFSL